MTKIQQQIHSAISIAPQSSYNIDDIPQDVQEVILKTIKSWAEGGQTHADRERGRKLRDSSLSALVRSSKDAMSLWRPALLQSVRISLFQLPLIYRPLMHNVQYARGVQSLHIIIPPPINPSQAKLVEKEFHSLETKFPVSPWKFGEERMKAQVFNVLQSTLEELVNLRELIIDDAFSLDFHFRQRIDGQMVPLTFLSHSLKRFHASLFSDEKSAGGLSGRNFVWLLSFTPALRQVSVGLTISHDDGLFLSEHISALEGRSKVKELALRIIFVFDINKKKTWWGTDEEQKKKWTGGNKKTEIAGNLLKITKQLHGLEFASENNNVRAADKTDVNSSCLSSLSKSYQSLRHLRLFNVTTALQDPSADYYLPFENLKIFGTDLISLWSFRQLKPPPNLRILHLAFYNENPGRPSFLFLEETTLKNTLESGMFSSLKEVLVPARPFDTSGGFFTEKQRRAEWEPKRRDLENLAMFKSGKTKLRTLELGEVVGDPAKDECCVSYLRWLAP